MAHVMDSSEWATVTTDEIVVERLTRLTTTLPGAAWAGGDFGGSALTVFCPARFYRVRELHIA
jgi:hypothetical protein